MKAKKGVECFSININSFTVLANRGEKKTLKLLTQIVFSENSTFKSANKNTKITLGTRVF